MLLTWLGTFTIGGMSSDPEAVTQRWVTSLSAHDLEAAVDCFDAAYVDEAPARRGESVFQVRDGRFRSGRILETCARRRWD